MPLKSTSAYPPHYGWWRVYFHWHRLQNQLVACVHMDLKENIHYNDVIMSPMASHIASLTIVYSTVYSGADHRKHQSSASLAFVQGIHRWPVNSPRKGPVTRKMFSFDDVIMQCVASLPVCVINHQCGESSRSVDALKHYNLPEYQLQLIINAWWPSIV